MIRSSSSPSGANESRDGLVHHHHHAARPEGPPDGARARRPAGACRARTRRRRPRRTVASASAAASPQRERHPVGQPGCGGVARAPSRPRVRRCRRPRARRRGRREPARWSTSRHPSRRRATRARRRRGDRAPRGRRRARRASRCSYHGTIGVGLALAGVGAEVVPAARRRRGGRPRAAAGSAGPTAPNIRASGAGRPGCSRRSAPRHARRRSRRPARRRSPSSTRRAARRRPAARATRGRSADGCRCARRARARWPVPSVASEPIPPEAIAEMDGHHLDAAEEGAEQSLRDIVVVVAIVQCAPRSRSASATARLACEGAHRPPHPLVGQRRDGRSAHAGPQGRPRRGSTSWRSPTTTPPRGGPRPTRGGRRGRHHPGPRAWRSAPGSARPASTCSATSPTRRTRRSPPPSTRSSTAATPACRRSAPSSGDLGFDITSQDVRRRAVDAAATGRPHVADVMIAAGVVATRDEAFERFLNPGRPAYVDRYAVPLGEAIGAGGGRRRRRRDRAPVGPRSSGVLTEAHARAGCATRAWSASRSTTRTTRPRRARDAAGDRAQPRPGRHRLERPPRHRQGRPRAGLQHHGTRSSTSACSTLAATGRRRERTPPAPGVLGLSGYLRPIDWKRCSTRLGTARVRATTVLYCAPGTENVRPLSKSARAVLDQELDVEPHEVVAALDLHPLVELGLGEAGAQRHHGHALRLVLVVRPLAEAVHPGLGRRVGPARQERRHRRDVDDPAAATLGHRSERGVREPQHRGDEHVEHRLLLLDGVLEEAVLEAEAGVVDQELDGPLAVGEPRLDGGALGPVDEIGHQDLHLDVVRRPQLLGHGGEAGLVAGHQHEAVATGGELAGEFEADAGGRAGHECRSHAPSKQVSPQRRQPGRA